MLDRSDPARRPVTAVLGPTNTGKTHYAIERMLGHRTGVIGLPLRLLAREVYDRVVALRGPSVAALVTGEERIVPGRAQYWICTVEAMPVEIGADFVAVDEIQLCADAERGHVFTDRLLSARGLGETLLLGSETMRPRIASLIPGAEFQHRERFSKLTWSGSRKLSRMPARTAIVGFSTEEVYAIAELIRRQRGGAAVVMGALSPRTRNAQVALYQNGDVDYMVATDAIGMGLNLDVRHVAFAGLGKFDGRRHRRLRPDEIAQIAGRAGRHMSDGTFGVTGDAPPFDEETVAAVENHRFAPAERLVWRNARLDFGSVEALIAALEEPPAHRDLTRAREADDLATLRALWTDATIRDATAGPAGVRQLWEVAQVPDFRKVGPGEHAALVGQIFRFLGSGPGCIPSDWLAAQIRRIDRTDGDIDTISKRLAYIRTWTYVAQRPGWLGDGDHWREETRAVEDRLSDALHLRLTERFVDRRTSVLLRRLKQRESLVAELNDKGELSVEGQYLGRLDGFLFRPDPAATGDEARTLRAAAQQALQMELARRAERFYNAPDPEIGLTEQGGLMWGEHAVGVLAKGADALSPEIRVFVEEDCDPAVAEKVARRLGHWIGRRIATLFQPLVAMRDDPAIAGLAKGIAFRLVEALGVIPREEVAADLKALDQEARATLRKHGVRFGQYTLFQSAVLKPAPTQLRIVLWGLSAGLAEFPPAPPPGLVTIVPAQGMPEGYYTKAGYRLAGPRAVRIDMLERLADMIRARDSRGGFDAAPEMLSITGLGPDGFAEMMKALGYRAARAERQRPRPEAKPEPKPESMPEPMPEPTHVPEAATVPEQEGTQEGVPEAAVEAAPEPVPQETAEAPAAEALAPVAAAMDAPPATEPAAAAEPAPLAATEPDTAPGGTELVWRFVWAPVRHERPERRPERQPERQSPRSDAPAGPDRGERRPSRGRRRRETLMPDAPSPAAETAPAAAPAVPPPPEPRPDAAPRAERPPRTDGPRDRPREKRPASGSPAERPPREAGRDGPGERRRDGKGPRERDRKPETGTPRVFSARPARDERSVDPDNPFAALLALKLGKE